MAQRREKEKGDDGDGESDGSERQSSSEGGDDEEDDDDRGDERSKKKKKKKATRVEKQLSQLTNTVSSLATVMKTYTQVRFSLAIVPVIQQSRRQSCQPFTLCFHFPFRKPSNPGSSTGKVT